MLGVRARTTSPLAEQEDIIMNRNSTNDGLETFAGRVRGMWGPLSTEIVTGCQRQLEELLRAPVTEAWLTALYRDAPASRELLRDPSRGFVLLAHTERAGLHRPPHDHGRAWVIYGVQHGEVEMATYGRTTDPGGRVRLVKREATLLRPGEARVFLPGDIHDTRCLSDQALLLRFTERDLKKEDLQEGRVTRYVERDGIWTVGQP